MLENKKRRAVVLWLLVLAVIFSFAGCDIVGSGVIGAGVDIEGGARGSLKIAGESVQYKEPQRKSIYYNAFDEVEKKIYDAAYTTLCENENIFKLIGVDINQYSHAYAHTLNQFINDHPEFFWLNGYVEFSTERMSSSHIGNITVTLGVHEYWVENDILAAQTELERSLSDIVAQANALADDYEKAKFVHDYIIEFNTYDYEAFDKGDAIDAETDARVSSAYGALVSGEVMCAGYARAFDLVMHELGIESIYVSGMADGGSHAWNLVLLGGNYYHIDLTWDDLDGEPAEIRYNYFGLTDEEISKTHTVSLEYSYPEATATEYNYFVKEELFVDYYSFAAVTKLAKKYDGSGIFAFKCRDAKVMSNTLEELVDNNMIFKLAGFENVDSFQYMADEDTGVLVFYMD